MIVNSAVPLWVTLIGLVPAAAASIGLVGIDDFGDRPFCAHACHGAFSGAPLECSVVHGDPTDHSGHAHVETSPECFANDAPFLTSLAWCINVKCNEVDEFNIGEVEAFWDAMATGDPTSPPMWTYAQALANITEEPTLELGHGATINETAMPPFFWTVLYGTSTTLYQESWNMNVFGLIILNVGFALPIVLTWLGYLPFIDRLYEELNPYLVWPSLIGTYHARPLPFNIGNAPTTGQALYIGLMILLNVVLSAINFQTTEMHLWFQNTAQQITGYLMYRTGVLSFSMAPLLILFSGRNNFLQWITNWPHSTFILLHRWIARLFTLQALLHTILAVVVYKDMGIYDVQAAEEYWAWGIVGTLFACVMIVTSALYLRRLAYEVFLITHIVFAILVIVGSWYHVVLRFEVLDGFTMWLWTACAVWFFDRVVRIARVVKVGPCRSKVVDIGDGYVRIDIPGVRWGPTPGQKVYAYFPSLTRLRPWENHPFSVLPFSLLSPSDFPPAASDPAKVSGDVRLEAAEDAEKKQITSSVAAPCAQPTKPASLAGISLFVRKSSGMTKRLRSHGNLLTFLEGPYPNTNSSAILRCDRIVLFAGGIGITGILPWTQAHPNVKLCWTVKASATCLVQQMAYVTDKIPGSQIQVGTRTDIAAVVEMEVRAGWKRIGVVACGPGALCDDVRAVVSKAARQHSTVFELEMDAYSW